MDNDGDPLQLGMIYWNTTTGFLKVYNGTGWQNTADVTTTVSWSQISDAPAQAGNAGKYLRTDGAVLSWQSVASFSAAQAYFFAGF